MITLDAFLVFLAAAALPVFYLWIVSRWVEPEYRKIGAVSAPPKPRVQQSNPLATAA